MDVNDLDHEHVSAYLRDRFCAILLKCANMWDGTIGNIKTAGHQIELISGTRPIAQAPHRADHKGRGVEDQEIQRMLKTGLLN